MKEIVVKIPDDMIKSLKQGNFGAKYNIYDLVKCLMNGTPLPEHHGRLIDADALQKEMDKDVRKAMSFVDLKDFVWLAPTIIEGSERK